MNGKNVLDIGASNTQKPILVIGGGPSALRCAREILKTEPLSYVTIFSDEPYIPYNRVHLSSFLAGEINRDQLDIPLPSTEKYPNFRFLQQRISKINREKRIIIDNAGAEHCYEKLIIATGSKAYIPNIEGNKASNVFTFRNMRDAETLFSRTTSSRHLVVIGGGLLGIEAAKALQRMNTKVTLVHQSSHLMNRQLDEMAAEFLLQQIQQYGINVVLNDSVRSIKNDANRVTGIITHNKNVIDCDTVLFCTGVSPNIALAKDCGLSVVKGIVVDNSLQTSDEHIYAIGECSEHQGKTYGLVAPCLEQASICAAIVTKQIKANSNDIICSSKDNSNTPVYHGSLTASSLKVINQTVSSIGEVNTDQIQKHALLRVTTYKSKRKGIYRKLITLKGKLIGAVSYGDWHETRRLQETLQQGRVLSFFNLLTFKLTGKVWGNSSPSPVLDWPDSAIICQCNALTKSTLLEAAQNQCKNLEQLQKHTGAGTVCGSCKPLLMDLYDTDENSSSSKEFAWPFILVISIFALLLTSIIPNTGEMQVADSVQTINQFESFWNDKFWKQFTGFSLLGFTAMGMLMSFRKRLKWQWMGNFNYWRLLHISLGFLCLCLLILHTGFHLGQNLNRWLILNFLILAALGTTAGIIIGLAHKFKPSITLKLRKYSQWLHILASWPLPALLSIHILSVYYF